MENTGHFPRQINSYKPRTAQIVITDNSWLGVACGVARENGYKLILSNAKEIRRGSLLPVRCG